MHHFIDRRQNPKGKSLGNRQRFLRRARAHIKETVDRAVRKRAITDVDQAEKVTIPTKRISEPTFHPALQGGVRSRIFPGNKEYVVGDSFDRPSGGAGQGGREGSPDGEGEDEFSFTLSREEFLELLFDDLELPDLIKTSLKKTKTQKLQRAGHTIAGTPSNLDVLRTMRNAYGRRKALRRPSRAKVAEVEERIAALETKTKRSAKQEKELNSLRTELGQLQRKRSRVPYVDPVDVRYTNFRREDVPSSKAVMFCLMDVSGSMGEREKDLAKRFFILLHLFLERRYESTDLVFIRHTHYAEEVDEDTFFHDRETGGTVVSTALTEMERVIADRYPSDDWNIYAAQASDGENTGGDSTKCEQLLEAKIMPCCQYYAYIEILSEREIELMSSDESGAELWQSFRAVHDRWPNFSMRRISEPSHIYPVFRELFARKPMRV